MEHTPGPWEVVFGGETWEVYSIDDLEVAAIGIDEYAEADARLIAASPDLLRELENLADRAESLVDSEFQTSKNYHPGAEFVKGARAAIAKARGQ